MAKKRKNKHKKEKVNPNEIKTRDVLMVALINGATKAGVYDDKKKRASRNSCRHFDSSEEME